MLYTMSSPSSIMGRSGVKAIVAGKGRNELRNVFDIIKSLGARYDINRVTFMNIKEVTFETVDAFAITGGVLICCSLLQIA